MISKKNQFSDIPFFITPNSFTGDLNLTKDVNAIKQSIKNIILTNSGERPFDVFFGADIYKNLFENLTMELMIGMQTKISSKLNGYESRIILIDVLIEEEQEPYSIIATVIYEIPELSIVDKVNIKILRNR